jgi:hypothetical protein
MEDGINITLARMRYAYRILSQKLKGIDFLLELEVAGRMILKWIFREKGFEVVDWFMLRFQLTS